VDAIFGANRTSAVVIAVKHDLLCFCKSRRRVYGAKRRRWYASVEDSLHRSFRAWRRGVVGIAEGREGIWDVWRLGSLVREGGPVKTCGEHSEAVELVQGKLEQNRTEARHTVKPGVLLQFLNTTNGAQSIAGVAYETALKTTSAATKGGVDWSCHNTSCAKHARAESLHSISCLYERLSQQAYTTRRKHLQ
jgi:hypothetical protein